MKKSYHLYLFVLVLVLLSCEHNVSTRKRNRIITNITIRNLDTCYVEKDILLNAKLQDNLWLNSKLPEHFPYILLMANKYQNAFAQGCLSKIMLLHCHDPNSLILITDTTVMKAVDMDFKQIPETMKKSQNAGKIYIESEFSTLCRLNNKSYFKSCHYTLPDSLSFDIAFRNLRLASKQNLSSDHLITLSLYYLIGYGTAQDSIQARYWHNKYWETQTLKNSLYDRQASYKCPDMPLIIDEEKEAASYFSPAVIDAINRGDKQVYHVLKNKFVHSNSEIELLYFSYVMANKYHYAPAYYDVYKYLWITFNYTQKLQLWDISAFDQSTKSIALYHLRKSASFGDKRAKIILQKINSPIRASLHRLSGASLAKRTSGQRPTGDKLVPIIRQFVTADLSQL